MLTRQLRSVVSLCLLVCLLLVATRARAQNDTMMQAFYWDVPTDDVNKNGDWWNNLAGKAPDIKRAGFTAVWTPPPSKGNFGIYDMGYGLFDHFDLGNYNQKGTTETRFGSRAELQAMIAAMHAQGLEVYTDTVLNHVFTDYRELEPNPAVKAYIDGEAHAGANLAYPTGEVVWRIPNAPAGDYYIQIKGYNLNCADATQRAYELYATWTNPDPAFPYEPNFPQVAPYNYESEPNNGTGQNNNFPGSGYRIWGFVSPCGDIDEYKITLDQPHDINLILDAKSGTPGAQLNGADPHNGYRIVHAYGPGNTDFAATTMQVLTYTGIDYLARYGVNHTGAGEPNWTWNYTHFHPVDAADYLQADCCDDALIPNAKIFGEDFNTFDARTLAQGGVEARLNYWGQWLVNTVGFDGYRLDFVRGYQEDFIADWIKAMPPKVGGGQRYVVGEYFSGNKARLKAWVNALAARGADADVFDFNLKFTLNGLANGSSASFDMRTLNHAGMVRDNTGNALSGLDVNTFVDNHDTGKDHNQWVFKDWQLPYAYILFAEGRPTVFYPHFYGTTQVGDGFTTTAPASLQTDIKNLVNIRRTFLDGAMVVNSETGNPDNGDGTSTNVVNLYVARRQGNAAAGKPGGILALNNHETQTKCLYVDNAPAGSGYVNWANSMLTDVTGHEPDTQVFADGRVLVCAPPRGYAVYVPQAAAATLPSITGQITDGTSGVAGVTVTLGGAQARTTTTDAGGFYSFKFLPTGLDYTVTPSAAGLSFAPASRAFVNLASNQTGNFTGTPPAAPPPATLNPGDVIISEFRLRGPGGASDEYVELYNTTANAITVGASDGSSGWAVAGLEAGGLEAQTRFVVPSGALIPAHGHYLATNSSTAGGPYSLGAYAAGDLAYTTDLPDDQGLALFTTANPANFTTTNRLDAVGFGGTTSTLSNLYRAGNGLAPVGAVGGEYAFTRRLASGVPQTTGDNAQDFVFVATDGAAYGGVQAQLGAPGPEGRTSPLQRNALVKASLVDTGVASTDPPNRVRDTGVVPHGALGTLTIRRKFRNGTAVPITRLRFRVVDITTLGTPNPGGQQADLRALDSVDVTVTTTSGDVLVRGTTLEQPPVQAGGGGLNSTLVVALPNGSLASGASVNVQFVLGVEAGGRFRFLVNVEALSAGAVVMQKLEGQRLSK